MSELALTQAHFTLPAPYARVDERGEDPPSAVPDEGRDGLGGALLCALEFLPDADSPAGGRPSTSWHGLETSIALQDNLRVVELPDLGIGDRRRLREYAAIWQGALPYSDLEWNELLLAWREDRRRGEALSDYQTVIRDEVGQKTLAYNGILRVTSGPELVARWEEWRSQSGPYCGQNALRLARSAMANMIRIVDVPHSNHALIALGTQAGYSLQ